jgi:diacylglycerol kinase family enzyme
VPKTKVDWLGEADHVLISVNPVAGRRSAAPRVDRLVELLGKQGFGVEVFTDLADVSAQANRLHAQRKLRALVGVGGDGTAAELVNRINDGVPVTLLAAGTANLLSKHFGLSGKPERLCRTIGEGRRLRLDAGRVGERLFLVMVSCGFDAHVVQQVHAHRAKSRRGGHIGYSSYLKPILKSIRSYHYPEIRVDCDERDEGQKAPLRARWVFACNLPRYGWGLPLAPRAVAVDGLLDLCTFGHGSLLAGLRYAAAAQLGGWHQRLPDCEMRRARRFRITSDEPVACQLDGDPGGELPLDVEVVPNRLTLVVPASWKRRGY